MLARFAGRSEPIAPRATSIVVAHPDDETIGAGSLLGALDGAVLLHVTDGSPKDESDARRAGCGTGHEYALLRRRELERALEFAGARHLRMRSLGIRDQDAVHHLADLARELSSVFESCGTEVVLTHPFEGGHPDHDAIAFAVRSACALLEHRGRRAPAILEMTSYHASAADGGTMATGVFLPGIGSRGSVHQLSEAAREIKRELYACFASQRSVLGAFRHDIERFRPAPSYSFEEPPHAGSLFYETFAHGATREL
ncbi:MAG TPA: PIG-L family deacetylase, partial [Planctomycetota bacterium]|nr:PIG-L family deacetylase [Planctomycetota bacterium]